MADERDKMLRKMAQHRGFRLVKSRRRRPGGDFGLYGLTDAVTGQDCFGIGKDGLKASADEIEDYLRGAAQATWKRSLKSTGKAPKTPASKRQAPKPEPEPEPRRRKPTPPPSPEPEPEPSPPKRAIRDARAGDAAALAALIRAAGSRAEERDVAATLRQLIQSGAAPLVAEEGGIVGCAAWFCIPALQHAAPIGRITLLLVEAAQRHRGIGRELIAAAERRLADRGCGAVEAVSDIELSNAHGFFRKLGYDRASYRFLKPA